MAQVSAASPPGSSPRASSPRASSPRASYSVVYPLDAMRAVGKTDNAIAEQLCPLLTGDNSQWDDQECHMSGAIAELTWILMDDYTGIKILCVAEFDDSGTYAVTGDCLRLSLYDGMSKPVVVSR
jgi:hypothetical protein